MTRMKTRSMVICEGESDQIILSYYFINQFHYKHTKKLKNLLDIQPSNKKNETEFVNLYTRAEDGDEVVIWAIGGKSRFGEALQALLVKNRNNLPNEVYSKILIITDHDNENETEQLWKTLNEKLKSFAIDITLSSGQWTEGKQKIGFDEPLSIKFLGLTVPPDEDGALETFLLKALAEQGNNGYLAEKSKAFVSELVAHPEKIKPYLSKRGLRVKAPLAVFLAIASPGRAFEELKLMFEAVSWEDYKTIQEGFQLLDEEFLCKDGI